MAETKPTSLKMNEAARKLGVTSETLSKWRDYGLSPIEGGGRPRYPLADIELLGIHLRKGLKPPEAIASALNWSAEAELLRAIKVFDPRRADESIKYIRSPKLLMVKTILAAHDTLLDDPGPKSAAYLFGARYMVDVFSRLSAVSQTDETALVGLGETSMRPRRVRAEAFSFLLAQEGIMPIVIPADVSEIALLPKAKRISRVILAAGESGQVPRGIIEAGRVSEKPGIDIYMGHQLDVKPPESHDFSVRCLEPDPALAARAVAEVVWPGRYD